MPSSIPGTTLTKTDETKDIFSDAIVPLINVTGGLMLSQLCELTGLETATIQNWVKRGYVSSPVAKKYSKEQVARILIINSLRDTMQLDNIAALLSYLNGNLLDESDDIIMDSELYMHFCKVTFRIEEVDTTKRTVIIQNIRETFKEYDGVDKDKLERALLIMVLAYQAKIMVKKADVLLKNILNEGD